jgi:hypothetical protein
MNGVGTGRATEHLNNLGPDGLVNAVEPKSATSIVDLQALDDAVRILTTARRQLARGSVNIWQILDHACKHLESQINAFLRP